MRRITAWGNGRESFADFVGLLVVLIGERLVLQLMHQAMPKVSKDDLYFD